MERWDPCFAERSAWLAPFRALSRRFAGFGDWPSPADIDARLAPDAGVRFIASVKPRRRRPTERYEVRIALRGEVPTRPRNWHDLLNALVWAAFPEAKRALTHRLAREQPAGPRRTRVQDRLALVDEGGVVTLPGGGALAFGHAILEHAMAGLRARVSLVPLAVPRDRRAIDAALAAHLDDVDRWAGEPRTAAVDLAALTPIESV